MERGRDGEGEMERERWRGEGVHRREIEGNVAAVTHTSRRCPVVWSEPQL